MIDGETAREKELVRDGKDGGSGSRWQWGLWARARRIDN